MALSPLFPTQLYEDRLARATGLVLNRDLERACLVLREEDRAGRAWSRSNRYPGYTSYASLNDLPKRSPTFAALQTHLDEHVAAFARALQFNLGRRRLKLDSMWVNVLDPAGVHSAHIHPHSAVSGTYYVAVPKGSGPLKLEDPRLPLMMAAPAKRERARLENRRFVYIEPKAGRVLLWESWLRHEVTAGAAKQPRISISFNYA